MHPIKIITQNTNHQTKDEEPTCVEKNEEQWASDEWWTNNKHCMNNECQASQESKIQDLELHTDNVEAWMRLGN